MKKTLFLILFCLNFVDLFGQSITLKSVFETKNQLPTCLNFSHDGQFLVSGGFNRKMSIYNTENNSKLFEYKVKDTPLDVKFSSDGRYIISGGKDKLITIFDKQSNVVVNTYKFHKSDVTSISVSSKDNSFVSGGKDGKVVMWNVNSVTPVKTFEGAKTEILSVALSPNGKTIIAGEKTGKMYVWDVESGQLQNTIQAHKGFLRDLLISTDGRYFVTCGDDKNIKVWDAKSNELENAFRYHKKWIQTIDITPDNKYLLSGSHDGYVVLAELATGKIIYKSEKQKDFVLSVDFSDKKDMIASTTLNAKKIFVMDAKSLNIDHDEVETIKKINTREYAKPLITLNNLATSSREETINLAITATSEIPLVSVSILKEGNSLFEYNETELLNYVKKEGDNYSLKLSKNVLLNEGANTYSVVISNASGSTESQFNSVNYVKPQPVVAQVPSSTATTLPVAAKKPSTTNSLYKWALIIGNEHYSQYQTEINAEADVLYASNDAREFKDLAKNVLGVPEENIIYIEDGTFIKMRRGLSKLSKVSALLGDKMEIYFYYAGHGYPDEKTKTPYLIPVDGNGTELEYEAISLKKVYAQLTEHNPKKVTAFIDACFSGGARQSGLVEARGFKVVPKEEKTSKNLVVFTASSGKESSLPYKAKQHGLFTYYLTEKIKETNGDISYQELSEYLSQTISIYSVTINNKTQTPQTNVSEEVGDKWKSWRLNGEAE